MKKIIAILMLVAVIMAGGMTADAKKKTSGRSKSSSSVVFPHYEDGYANISGHTYSAKYNGETATIKFGRDGIARLSGSGLGTKGSYKLWWSYQGMGIVSIFGDDGSQSIDFYIEDDGKSLIMDMDGEPVTFKLK